MIDMECSGLDAAFAQRDSTRWPVTDRGDASSRAVPAGAGRCRDHRTPYRAETARGPATRYSLLATRYSLLLPFWRRLTKPFHGAPVTAPRPSLENPPLHCPGTDRRGDVGRPHVGRGDVTVGANVVCASSVRAASRVAHRRGAGVRRILAGRSHGAARRASRLFKRNCYLRLPSFAKA